MKRSISTERSGSEAGTVLIAGPTASGKSALALALAEALGGTIINADSMQVYRDLRIITARPTPEEEARVPHWLYGHVDAAENYSVGRWCVDASARAGRGRAGRALPIVVGGTGLYFKALTRGLAAVPPIPAEIRSAVAARLEARGHRRALCRAQRSATARARAADAGRPRARHPRARGGGGDRPFARRLAPRGHAACARSATPRSRSFSMSIGRSSTAGSMPASTRCWPPARSMRCARSPARAVSTAALPAMKAHGVPWLIRHLTGEIDLAGGGGAAKRDTRRYTKRQATWFRHQLPDWTWVAPDRALGEIRRALAADARAFAARSRRRRRRGRRQAPTTPVAPPCRCRNGRAGRAARRRRW